jgi:hypothetical protein
LLYLLVLRGVFGLLPGAVVFPLSAFGGAVEFAAVVVAAVFAPAALVLVAVAAPGVKDFM